MKHGPPATVELKFNFETLGQNLKIYIYIFFNSLASAFIYCLLNTYIHVAYIFYIWR